MATAEANFITVVECHPEGFRYGSVGGRCYMCLIGGLLCPNSVRLTPMKNLTLSPRGSNSSHRLRDFALTRYEVNLFEHWQKHHDRLGNLV